MGSVDPSSSPPTSPQSPSPSRPSILFLDAYDSFSNNITSLLTTLLNVDVFVLPIDTPLTKDAFHRELRHYAAVVCGPGPGSPEKAADVGLMRWLWELPDDDDDQQLMIPVLGVCLGFQSLVLACGGKVQRLRRGLHGMVRTILHREGDVFAGVESFQATLYHSLCADVGQHDIEEDWERLKWDCPVAQPDLVPLAWVEEDRGDGQGVERILMAVKHRQKPFWGLQYHPESVCTEEKGNKVIANWFSQALSWNRKAGRVISTHCRGRLARNSTRSSLLEQTKAWNQRQPPPSRDPWGSTLSTFNNQIFRSCTISLKDGIEVPDIAEILNSNGIDHIILDSANGDQPPPITGVDVRGRFSVIAVEVDDCLRIEHHTPDNFITVVHGRLQQGRNVHVPMHKTQTVWHLLAEFHESRRSNFEAYTQKSPPNEDQVPFLGGFMGYVTYEQGLSDIDIQLPRERGHRRPDVCLAWVTKSVIIDHEKGLLHVQNLEGDSTWIDATVERLQSAKAWGNGHHRSQPKTSIQKPERAKYEAKVRMCQEYIAAGESYELCLTDQTHITTTSSPRKNRTSFFTDDPSWPLYRTLRRRNPAPFASYIRLGGATLVSSSPERFLQYDRTGRCSMKPMKGTVKKSSDLSDNNGCASTLAEAEAILHTPKEEAENLMIVDLVRHDLHGVCGAGRVRVPDLLKVEEYQTVFTMITRVEGELPPPPSSSSGGYYSGLDVLAASLPPGSMTGAPKKRSCEILQRIEGGGGGRRERSLYSGVVGYMCVTGRGDWSVTIRSLFRWDDEGQEDKELWHIGAGGAVTILSTPEGEREEMFVKLARPLSIFLDEDI